MWAWLHTAFCKKSKNKKIGNHWFHNNNPCVKSSSEKLLKLSKKCSGVESTHGNTQVKHKYLKIVLTYTTWINVIIYLLLLRINKCSKCTTAACAQKKIKPFTGRCQSNCFFRKHTEIYIWKTSHRQMFYESVFTVRFSVKSSSLSQGALKESEQQRRGVFWES